MIIFGAVLIVMGIVLIVGMRGTVAERTADSQNAFFGRDLVKAEWVQRWNLILGSVFAGVGVILIAVTVFG